MLPGACLGAAERRHCPLNCLALLDPMQGSWAALSLTSPVACTPGADGCADAQGACGAGTEAIAIGALGSPWLLCMLASIGSASGSCARVLKLLPA